LLRKWLAKLPHPYTAQDRKAGHRYQVSIFQTEFSLTQVLDRPQTGRIFFEEIIRENLDLGRPDSRFRSVRQRSSFVQAPKTTAALNSIDLMTGSALLADQGIDGVLLEFLGGIMA
jgi:hypothetical protein